MNIAKYLGDITNTSERGVRVWFSRKNKSLESIDDVRAYMEFKFTPEKKRSDKGKSRPTPWLDEYKYKKSKTKGNCIVCGNTTSRLKMVWNEKIGEEIELFICTNCSPDT